MELVAADDLRDALRLQLVERGAAAASDRAAADAGVGGMAAACAPHTLVGGGDSVATVRLYVAVAAPQQRQGL